MIGGIGGIGFLISYLGFAWSKSSGTDNFFASGVGPVLGVLAIMTVIGVFLFPRTIGMLFTPMSFATPIAFLISLFRNGISSAIWVLVLGVLAWLITFLVGNLRPDAT